MPYVAVMPRLSSNTLVFAVDISPMRVRVEGNARPDRIGGTVTISRPGIDLTRASFTSNPKGKVMLKRTLPTRQVTKAGLQEFRLTLPRKVPAEQRSGSPTQPHDHRQPRVGTGHAVAR